MRRLIHLYFGQERQINPSVYKMSAPDLLIFVDMFGELLCYCVALA